jgi:ATP-binding protein involved in chromosome partitioning
MFRQLNVPIFGVIENMSYLELPDGEKLDVFGMGGGQQLAEESGVPFLGAIPMDPEVRESGDNGKPVAIAHPESQVSRAFNAITQDLAARISVAALSGENVVPIEMVG